MQGRVMGLVSSASAAMTPLGLLIAGPVSEVIGIRAWYWIAGVVTLLMGAAGFFIPAVMNVEDNHDSVADGAGQALPTPAD
jgi:DHA3 family macrolide efflux protein-like MFS transporter